jgi:hypothetical protein
LRYTSCGWRKRDRYIYEQSFLKKKLCRTFGKLVSLFSRVRQFNFPKSFIPITLISLYISNEISKRATFASSPAFSLTIANKILSTMHKEIEALETSLNTLLPVRKLNPSPGKELLDTMQLWSEKIWEASRIAGPWPLTDEEIGRGRSLIQHPLFVCGVHRSGTTLLRNLLDGHPELTTLPSEGSFLTNFADQLNQMPYRERESFLAIKWIRRLANPINQPPYWSLGVSTASASPYVDFARKYSAWYGIAEKSFGSETMLWPHLVVVLAYASCCKEPLGGLAAKYWVDKTPTNEKYLQKIWRELPEAKVIQMVRSPVDTFLSRKRMEPSLNVKSCLQDMRRSYRIASEQYLENESRYLAIRYEELCEAPHSVICRITKFLDIEPDPCLFKPTVAGKAAHVNSSFNASLPAGIILKTRIDSHSGDLSTQDCRLLSAFISRAASQIGYQLKSPGSLETLLLKLKLKLVDRLVAKFNFLK